MSLEQFHSQNDAHTTLVSTGTKEEILSLKNELEFLRFKAKIAYFRLNAAQQVADLPQTVLPEAIALLPLSPQESEAEAAGQMPTSEGTDERRRQNAWGQNAHFQSLLRASSPGRHALEVQATYNVSVTRGDPRRAAQYDLKTKTVSLNPNDPVERLTQDFVRLMTRAEYDLAEGKMPDIYALSRRL